ncbi:DUF2207 domain-containing protein [Bifidobacterium sp. ESL0769]|uniref:DUF2207 domain-containing protein n=1 Tax=Bifidobacterium sp. ESL0769 TaxID=2983229 RepID=UPI0023F9A337|nr:DUF2207 domain-containing protein [Bifidobacterium sp. ESL0769]WEV67129.1 DUF2207 domain-containing protein [Bifidobacterium sp. ESL0769]
MKLGQGLNPGRIGRAAVSALVGTAVVIVFFAFCGFQSGDIGFHRADMTYRSLDYDATVRPDGDLRITEHVDMKLGKRAGGKLWRQVFQRYTLHHGANSDGVLSAITDVSVTNVSTGQRYRHGSSMATRDLDNLNWNMRYAGQWYATALASANDNEGDEYLPANMNDSQYGQKMAELNPAKKSGAEGPQAQAALSPLLDENGASASMGKSGDTVEIGWNIPATRSAESLKFDISMTFKDVVKVYNDVAYFKWEPLGDTNGVPVDDFHAKVTLPKGVNSADTRQWMHYAGKGSVVKSGSRELTMQAQNVPSSEHIDLVSMFSASSMNKSVAYRIKKDGKDAVIRRERAERQNAGVDVAMRRKVILQYVIDEGAVLLFALLAVIVTNWRAYYPEEQRPSHAKAGSRRWKKAAQKKAGQRKTVKSLEQVPQSQAIPDMTPACAAKFSDFLDWGEYSHDYRSRQMSSTLLSLVAKGVISVYPGQAKWFRGIDLSRASDEEISQRLREVSEAQERGDVAFQPSEESESEKAEREIEESRDEAYVKRAKARGVAEGKEAEQEILAEAAEYKKHGKPTSTVVLLPAAFAENVDQIHSLTATERALLNLLKAMSLKLDTPIFDFRTVAHELDGWWKVEWLQTVFNWTADYEYLKLWVVTPLLLGFAAAAAIVTAGVVGALWAQGLAFSKIGTGTDDYGHVCDQLHGQWGVSLLLGAPVIFLLILLFKLLRYRGLTRRGMRLVTPMLGFKAYLSSGGDNVDGSERKVSDRDSASVSASVVSSAASSPAVSVPASSSTFTVPSGTASNVSETASNAASSGTASTAASAPLTALSSDKFDEYYIYANALGLSDHQMQRFGGLFSWLGDESDDSLRYWYWYPYDLGASTGLGSDSSLTAQFSDLAAGISNGMDTLESSFAISIGSGGGAGGSFGGSGGGSGGGSFGGR